MNLDAEITLGHGSGGKRTRRLIRELFVRLWRNPALENLGDSAELGAVRGVLHFTTDAYVVNPLFFPGGDIGKLAVTGTVNDLAVSGAVPRWLCAGFVIEEGFPLSDLERIAVSMKEAADDARVQLVAGDTKVVEKGSADGLFITTAGVGFRHRRFRGGLDRIRSGDALIVNGNLGEHGLAVLLARKQLPFEASLESDCAALGGLVEKVLEKGPVHFMRDLTRGGLAAALNEVAEGKRFGIALDEEALPISAEVRGVCELVGFDPLYIANEGKAVFFVEKSAAKGILRTMKAHPLGENSRLIGEVTGDYPGRVYLRTGLGGMRVVDMREADQLPRIC